MFLLIYVRASPVFFVATLFRVLTCVEWTDYIMLELLKNSMRATVEWHGVDADYPPIKVVIADSDSNEDVVIKVSDEGGGIPRSNTKKIWVRTKRRTRSFPLPQRRHDKLWTCCSRFLAVSSPLNLCSLICSQLRTRRFRRAW
jgi:hypothetical protein